MNETPILYVGEKNISSWSMRAWVAMTLKGVPFEERTISLIEDRDRSRRYAVSPTGKVPVLHHGDRVIPDSLAIIEYLDETFPSPRYPALWPADAGERAWARWLAAAMHAGFTNLRAAMSFHLCFHSSPPQPAAEALAEAAQMLSLFETTLARKRGDGPFLLGRFCAADIMYAPAAVRLAAFAVPTDPTPAAAVYLKALLAQPVVRGWLDAARALPPAASY